MIMPRFRHVLIAAAITTLSLAASPVANAQSSSPVRPGSPATAAGSGYLYAWSDAYYSGALCSFFNSDSNWQDNCGNFRNRASSLWNDTAHGNSVNLYYHPNYSGAWACLHAGEAWDDLSNGGHFNWGPGRDGYGEPANDEFASSKWISGDVCDNNHS
jgi:hypothetical protein